MGDWQRLVRINQRIMLINRWIAEYRVERVLIHRDIGHLRGQSFIEAFEEMAKIDNVIWIMRQEVVRLQGLQPEE